MNTPLGSPRLAASTARFRNRIPTQVKRCVPIYLGVVLFLLMMLNLDLVGRLPNPLSVFRHDRPSVAVRSAPRRGETFPQKIWQTWKMDPLLFGIRDTVTAHSWLDRNPHMRYEVITDANEMTYVDEHFGPRSDINRPDIVDFYHSVKLPIIKADLLRYMIMYAEGGVYADIDVEALKPMHRFFPERHDEADYDIIVGVEIDQPEFSDHPILGQKSMSFCQWTIIARPRQPVMLRLVENIMKWLTGVAREQGVAISDVELDFDQVISGTGPSAFTTAILEEMTRRSPKKRKVTWDEFHNLDESKVVGRILVLTVEAFCAGQGHSDSGNHNSRGALVKHHYHASNWPSRHPRFSHPAYGQVENCNWNPDCVRTWDDNVRAFETLPQDEKQVRIDAFNDQLRKDLEALQKQQKPKPKPRKQT